MDPALVTLLNRFGSVFEPPHGLPPNREQDHQIHLLPETLSVNVKPYRYPHFQKREIE